MRLSPTFSLNPHFWDPKTIKVRNEKGEIVKDENGKDKEEPYAPVRLKELLKECYSITKNTSTPYSDVLKMTPTERSYMLSFLIEEFSKNKEIIEKQTKETQEQIEKLRNKRKNR